MKLTYAPLLVIAAALALAGCASSTSSPSSSSPPVSSAPAAAPSTVQAAAAPSASPSSAICTTHACIVDDLQRSLVGLIAQDESVSTKATCYKSTVVFHKAADTYSATCVVEYSDGSSASGTGNLLVSQDKVTFSPSGQ